jgi:signal transduction histidine kinase
MRPTVRLRLTAWYASIFLLGGAVLLAISYVIVSRNTGSFPTRVGEQLTVSGGRVLTPEGPIQVGPGVAAPTGVGSLTGPDGAAFVQLEQARQAAEQKVTADLRRQTAIDFALALLGTTLASLLAGWIVAGRALRPVAQITATARKVAAEGDLGERIALDGPADELRELADTFDTMLERLDRTFASQRSFVANASHELRTPLAIMRAEIEERLDDPAAKESELREMAAVVHDAVGRSEALIASLLTLARGEEALRRRDDVSLDEIVGSVVERNEPDAAGRGLRIEIAGTPAPCSGDRDLLEHLVANLVENGLRYNHAGGFVLIETGHDDHNAVLRVSNSGDVVPAEGLAQLFDPFFRLDSSRSRDSGGAGLGLSIVAAVAATHGGAASAAARDGGGLVVTVMLPMGPPAPATENRAHSEQTRIEPPERRLGRRVEAG